MPDDLPQLTGPGVTLVPVAAGDVEGVLAGRLGRRSAGPGWPHANTAAGLGFVAAGGWCWLVVDDADAVVGEIGTKGAPDATGAVEIGYGLAGPSRSRGLGTAAVGAVVRWLVTRPDVRTVVAQVRPDNIASWRLLERLDFAYAGTVDDERRYERVAAVDGRRGD